jgi:hypothetical protein
MQLVPQHAEKKSDDETGHGRKDDENGGSQQAKWPDYKNWLNKVHPEYKVDQGLRPAKSNQESPAEMGCAE